MHHLPNAVTVLRFLLVLPTGWCVLQGDFATAFGLFLLAGISDGIDGALARGFGWTSRFGAIADPLADKVLVAVTYVALAWEGVLPAWLATLVVVRDLVIVGGALGYHFLVAELEMAPTMLGKINTLANILFVGLVLGVLADSVLVVLAPLVEPGVWVMALLTVVSGADYVRTWSRKASHERRGARDA